MSQSPPSCNLTAPLSLYSCDNPYPNCTNPFGFQFSSFWTITQAVAACPSDPRLFNAAEPSLTLAACINFAGTDSWTRYPTADIWSRLTTWKFPLLQLVAVFPRPPLTFGNGIFVLAHLLGNPVSTLKSLLLKFASCQMRAEHWIARFDSDLKPLLKGDGEERRKERERRWKALALIVVSYDEWGHKKGDAVQKFLDDILSSDRPVGERIRFLDICERRANALARDRSTESLPMIAAQAIFIGSIAIAFGRTPTAAEGATPSTYINIEAHSIAFSALYFWLIPAGILASIIGVSQTETAIPEIIHDLETDIQNHFDSWVETPAIWHLFDDNDQSPSTALRQRKGGFYSWQPEDVRKRWISDVNSASAALSQGQGQHISNEDRAPRLFRCLTLAPGSWKFSLLLVVFSIATGLIISAIIPPDGFWCRDWLEASIGATWLVNAGLDVLPALFGWHGDFEYARIYAFTFTKDTLSTIITLLLVILTQVGILNRCACYSIEDRTGLAFPEISWIAGTLTYNIRLAYPAIAFLCIAFELLVFPYFVYRQHRAAFRVFLQRDDRESNLRHWHQLRDSRLVRAVHRAVSWLERRVKPAAQQQQQQQQASRPFRLTRQHHHKKTASGPASLDPAPGDIERTGTSSARDAAGEGHLLLLPTGRGQDAAAAAAAAARSSSSNEASENEPNTAAESAASLDVAPRPGYQREPSSSSTAPMLPRASYARSWR